MTGRKAALACVAALVLLAAVVMLVRSDLSDLQLSKMLPLVSESAPLILVDAEKGEFPVRVLTFFTESPAVSAEGITLTPLLPVFARAERSALVVTERDAGIAFYGAVRLSRSEQRSLAAGKLPDAWARLLRSPELTEKEKRSFFELRAANLPSPLCLELHDGYAFIANNLSDAEDIRRVRTGEAAGMKRRWSLERRWGGHMLLSDGGVLAAADGGGKEPLCLEIAWDARKKGGKAKWNIAGLEKRMGKQLARSLKTHNWAAERPAMPDPVLMAVGINLPDPGKNMANLPGWVKPIAEQLTKLGLREREALAILPGPATLSVGGRAQVLWFEFPGVVLDVPGRGKLAYKLLDLFWEQLFMGVEPKPAEGFKHGGMTDLPFSMLAAANDKKMIISLTEPAKEPDQELNRLIEGEKKAIGWFYVDFPLLGASIAEMPTLNALLSSEDDERSIDSESTDRLRETLEEMGKLFVVWDNPTGGRAAWQGGAD